MIDLSVAIITQNEEKNIRRCLESVKWVKDIVVLDSMSTDKTKDICREFNCNFLVSPWLGFGKMKAIAVENTVNEWVLSIDADEELTAVLITEIQQILQTVPQYFGYRIKRKSFYLGSLIRHCGWDKDYTLRLFNKTRGNFNDKSVHEYVELDGSVGYLNNEMLHYTYPTLATHYEKMRHYAELGAEILFNQHRNSSPFKALLRGFLKFIKMFLLQKGFLDGLKGFMLSVNSAWGVYYKYLLLWEMNKSKSST
jgi:glycosyltransferase involved in cell wall biosynthesis